MTSPERAERTLVRDLAGRAGSRVRVCGWADAVGPDGAVVLRDHTGTVNVVAGAPAAARAMAGVTPESAIEASGTVGAASAERSTILVEQFCVHALAAAPLPLPLDGASPLGARLDWRYLDLRRPRNRVVFEVQTTLEQAMRAWFADHGFLELHSPKLRAIPNQSGRELFTLRYFERDAYLAQSPQFSKQMAMCAGLERVFEFGPVFRANPLITSRHDTEFVSVDVEVSWIDSHHDLIELEERWLQHAVAAVARRHGADIRRHFGREVRAPAIPFPRITMAEAQARLAAHGHRSSAREGDLDAEGERLIGQYVAAELGHELVFVTDYPAEVRPFYHMQDGDAGGATGGLTRSFDLLWNGLEVTTGSQREHRYERLVAQAGRNPARVEAIRPYLDFFRHGCPPHGGFGVGLTRVLMSLLRVEDVREVTFLPRDRDRLSP